MIFAREEYSPKLVQEMKPLFARHHQETAAYADIPNDPNYAVYEQCESYGSLRIYTARVDGVLAGYQMFFVNWHPHSRKSLQAVQDILFLDKQHRKGLAGMKFCKWCVDQLKAEKVDVVYQHINARHDFGHMLERLGFELVDLVYGLKIKPK